MKPPKDYPLTDSAIPYEAIYNRVLDWLYGMALLIDRLDGDLKQTTVDALNFIQDHSHLAQAAAYINDEGEHCWALKRYDYSEERSIGILPLFKANATLHSFFEDQLTRLTYYEGSRTIYLPPARISPLWHGILILHEITHARNHLEQKYTNIPHGHWVEEHDVFRLETAIMQQLYGTWYDRTVDALADQFVKDIERHDFTAKPPKPHFGKAIDRIMGKPHSHQERVFRIGAANIDAIYRAFDRLGRTDYAAVTAWFYGSPYEDKSEASTAGTNAEAS